jgi:hypothetical protein
MPVIFQQNQPSQLPQIIMAQNAMRQQQQRPLQAQLFQDNGQNNQLLPILMSLLMDDRRAARQDEMFDKRISAETGALRTQIDAEKQAREDQQRFALKMAEGDREVTGRQIGLLEDRFTNEMNRAHQGDQLTAIELIRALRSGEGDKEFKRQLLGSEVREGEERRKAEAHRQKMERMRSRYDTRLGNTGAFLQEHQSAIDKMEGDFRSKFGLVDKKAKDKAVTQLRQANDAAAEVLRDAQRRGNDSALLSVEEWLSTNEPVFQNIASDSRFANDPELAAERQRFAGLIETARILTHPEMTAPVEEAMFGRLTARPKSTAARGELLDLLNNAPESDDELEAYLRKIVESSPPDLR